MRYPAPEKLEIIRLVEQSHLPVRRTLAQIGVPPATFYRWYDLYQTGGPEALEDRSPRPGRVWNRIPDEVRGRIVQLALDEPELAPRELAVQFTDTESYFVSEASVYRLLKAHDLISSPAFIVIKAADEFKDKTTAPNQLWQTCHAPWPICITSIAIMITPAASITTVSISPRRRCPRTRQPRLVSTNTSERDTQVGILSSRRGPTVARNRKTRSRRSPTM